MTYAQHESLTTAPSFDFQAPPDPCIGVSFRPTDLASETEKLAFIQAFKIIVTLDLRCLENLQMAKIIDAAKNGMVNVAQLYESCINEIVTETGLTKLNLEAIGVPLAIPNFLALPQSPTCDYINEIYPNGSRKHLNMLDSEEKDCILASLLHIASSQDPSVENIRAVLKMMPPCYLLKSWTASKFGDASKACADIFMFLRGNEVDG